MTFRVELEFIRLKRNIVDFRICEQNFRNTEWSLLNWGPDRVGNSDHWWRAKNGWELSSQKRPEVWGPCELLFLRGSERSKDREVLQIGASSWRPLVGAVREFNKWAKDARPRLSLEEEFFRRVPCLSK